MFFTNRYYIIYRKESDKRLTKLLAGLVKWKKTYYNYQIQTEP